MNKSQLKQIIKEEIRKVLNEANLEQSVYNGLSDSSLTPDDFIILDMISGMDGFNKMLEVLKSQKVKSCVVEPGSLGNGYEGFNVVVTLESGNQIKLFIDEDNFSGTGLLKLVKGMTAKPAAKPNGKLLAAAIKSALDELWM
jgi:hypothetical protein